MTNLQCSYDGDREGTLIAYLYDDLEPAVRDAFDDHLAACARCRVELNGLRGVRSELARWNPPEPTFIVSRQSDSSAHRSADRHVPSVSWRTLPAWAQAAAALLFLGVSAGIANLDVRYDANGFAMRTGWMPPQGGQVPLTRPNPGDVATTRTGTSTPSTPAAPGFSRTDLASKADLTSLERQMREEMRALQTTASRPASDADTLRKVRSLVDESERRQQRELALRLAQAVTDMNSQRQADLRRMQVSLSGVQRDLGVEVLRQQERVNYLMRVNQRQ